MKPKPAEKSPVEPRPTTPADTASAALRRETEVWRRIAAGERAYAEGRVVPHETAAERIRTWAK